jgi:hypothetical protein
MPPPQSSPRPMRPRAATPQERGEELAKVQRQLKAEAAARREKAAQAEPTVPTQRTRGRRG